MDMGEARSPEGVEISLSEPPHNADDALQENLDWFPRGINTMKFRAKSGK